MQLDDGLVFSNKTEKDFVGGYNIEKHYINNENF